MTTINFYSPDIESNKLFEHNEGKWIGDISNNLTFWVVTAYRYLRQYGFNVEIVNNIPEQGILLADTDSLLQKNKKKFLFLRNTMLICAIGDKEFHPSAHIAIVQNMAQINDNLIWNPYYIPPCPQPSLISRDVARGNRLENIAYMGTRSQLASELLSTQWINSLQKLDCNWHPMFKPSKWSNYADIDLCVSVRSFDDNPYDNKPASKLINCWCAGVPVILSPESAYLSLRKSKLDFMIARSLEDCILLVEKLKTNPKLYQAMIENGQKRAKKFTESTISTKWINFFNNYVIPEYEKWIHMSQTQKSYLYFMRYILFRKRRLKYSTQKLLIKKT